MTAPNQHLLEYISKTRKNNPINKSVEKKESGKNKRKSRRGAEVSYKVKGSGGQLDKLTRGEGGMRNKCNENYQQGEQGTRFESWVIQRVVYHFFSKHIIIMMMF